MHEPRALCAHRRVDAVLPVKGAGLALQRNGRSLVDVAEIAFDRGGISVVLGPNGAGKSLLVRMLCGLVAPDRGRIMWGDTPPGRSRALRVGFVFQKPVLLRRSALANIAYALALAGIPWRERRTRALAALAHAGLGHLAHSPARLLSGGEQQRLQLARAMSVDPEVLFLDEPTASADPASTAAIEALVGEASRRGTKIVLITHDLAQARRMADEVVFMHRGRIVERAPAEAFFAAPASQAARTYLAGRIVV